MKVPQVALSAAHAAATGVAQRGRMTGLEALEVSARLTESVAVLARRARWMSARFFSKSDSSHRSIDPTESIRALAREIAGDQGVRWCVRTPPGPFAVSPVIATHLMAIAREALVNMIQHSRATTVSLRLTHRPADLTLSIRDDGDGFNTVRNREQAGLPIMRFRARMVRGLLSVRSVPGCGTLVRCRIPL